MTMTRASHEHEADPKVRHEFVGMMFAVAIGELGLQTATLVQQRHVLGLLPIYSHLFLALCLIAASWVGWTRTPSAGGRKDLTGVFGIQFVILLVDVLLVVLYFILVKAMDLPGEENGHPRYSFSAAADAGWLSLIFLFYLVWDFLTKGVALWYKRPANREQVAYVWRKWCTVFCLILALMALPFVWNVDASHVVLAEFALLCLILLFRALKDYASARWPYNPSQERPEGQTKSADAIAMHKAKVWCIACLLALIGSVLCAHVLPLPRGFVAQVRAAESIYGRQAVPPELKTNQPPLGDAPSASD